MVNVGSAPLDSQSGAHTCARFRSLCNCVPASTTRSAVSTVLPDLPSESCEELVLQEVRRAKRCQRQRAAGKSVQPIHQVQPRSQMLSSGGASGATDLGTGPGLEGRGPALNNLFAEGNFENWCRGASSYRATQQSAAASIATLAEPLAASPLGAEPDLHVDC